MKKSLFAIAAVTAFAGAAQAQSSVTVYGLVDYGYGGASQRQAYNGTVTKIQNSGFGGSGESTSRLGFRGTEDLGGGLNAFFTIEAALVTDPTGNTTGSGVFSNSGSGNRQTFVGLGKKGLGQASLGVQYTPLHEEVGATNAGGANNQMGDVIYDRSGNGTAYTASGMSTNDSYTIRSSNALILKSERMAGIQFKGMFVSRGTDTTQTASAGGQSTNMGLGANLNYTWQKLYVTAAYQQFNQEQSNAVAATTATATTPAFGAGSTFAPGYNAAVVTAGINAKDTQQYYAASYDFGILKAFVGYVNRKVVNDLNAANYVSRTASQVGVRAPVTKTVQAWASVGQGRINNGGNASPTADFYGWQIGSDYSLSKRTNLYAIYGVQNTSNSLTGAYGSTTVGTAMNSWNQSSYAVGMRHTF
jgi:predicted porin